METEYCGLPRGGIESFDDSHGSILGCWRKSVNHEQPVRATARTTMPARRTKPRLALTTHLLRSVLLENSHGGVGAVRIGHDPNPEVSAAEARVVADGGRQPGHVREGE